MAKPEITFPSIPFEEAIAALKRRGINLVPSEHWATVWQQTHHSMFTVARSAGFDILGDIHAALMRVQQEGRTFNDFKRDLMPILQKKGWWGKTTVTDPDSGELREVQLGSPRRLRTIYDVNLRVSQAQGNWQRQQEGKATRPYLRYVGIVDNRIRPLHRLWHGRVLPVDHPWWKVHYPPNGWRCRCSVMSLSVDDLERFGFEVSGDPAPDDMVPWRNPATGEIIDVPRGIDPGWAYNPGAVDQAARAAKLAMDKLVALPPSIGAEAVVKLAFAFPQIEREFAAWISSISGEVKAGIFHPTGERRVLGALSGTVLTGLLKHNITPSTAAISTSKDDIIHMLRTVKVEPLSISTLMATPRLLADPDAIYLDLLDTALVYVFEVSEGAGKLIVQVNVVKRAKREIALVNNLRTGKLIKSLSEFANRGRYDEIYKK